MDWIFDREVETRSSTDSLAAADGAWRIQAGRLSRNAFYRQRFRAAGANVDDVESVQYLARLPLCTKDDLRAAQEAAPPFGEHLGTEPAAVKLVYQTSGTTGRPSIIALTRDDALAWRRIGCRTYRAAGVNPHNSVLTAYAAGPFVAGHTHGVLDELGARRIPIAPGDTERAATVIERGLVDTLLGTPTFALHLARVLVGGGKDVSALGIRRVITGGEPGGGLPGIRRRLETAFGADVTEAMGLGDVSPSLFGECAAQAGMHFCGQDYVWPELIDPASGDLLDIEAGARGELVYTSLCREAMPVVRFRSRDLVEIQGTDCECGRTSFRMRCMARTDDMFIVRGINVYPPAVVSVVSEFQPFVTGRARIVLPAGTVSVVPPVRVQVETPDNEEPGWQLAQQIEAAIRAKLTFRTSVELLRLADFGDASYKTNLVLRLPSPKEGTAGCRI